MALSWSLVGSPSTSRARAICYSATLDRWVCLGDVAMYSDDGITWQLGTAVDYPANTNFVAKNAIIWNENLQLFIAVCSDNNFLNDNHILTSPDGITWTTRTGNGVPLLKGIAYEPVTGFTVIVAHNGGCLTSSDGINWTAAGNNLVGVDATADWQWVTFVPALTLFIAVAQLGTVRIATSPDGLTWTGRHGAEPSYQLTWNYVAANTAGNIVVAACGPNGRFFMRSQDGITWETPYLIPAIAAQSTEAYIVFWSEILDTFVLLIDNDSALEGQVYLNPTGEELNWTLDSLIPDTVVFSGSAWEWQALAENPAEGRFVAGQENDSDDPFATALAVQPDVEVTGSGGIEVSGEPEFSSSGNMTNDTPAGVGLGGIEVGGDFTTIVLSADVSGMYTLVPGQHFDRVYTRNVDPDDTEDVAIPQPFGKTGFFGG